MGIFRLLTGAVVLTGLIAHAVAQNYPAKPIRLVVGFGAGGGADAIGRLVGQKLSENLGQPVIIENRPGANGAIAIERVIAAPADGYTLFVMSSSFTLAQAFGVKLPYDTERDLAPVSLMTTQPYVLVVHPSVTARNLRELIALARSRPGQLNHGSSGVGGASHLAGELLNSMANIKIGHVPYKGGADNVVATASGQIEMSFASIPAATPFLKNERVKALAVTTLRRSLSLPAVPTMSESGLPGYDISGWLGIVVHSKVDKDIIAKLSAMIARIVNLPEIKESFGKQGVEPLANAPEEFAALIHNELAVNTKLIRSLGLKAE